MGVEHRLDGVLRLRSYPRLRHKRRITVNGWRRYVYMVLWPFPNLKAWVAFLAGFFTGALCLALLVGIGLVVFHR